MTLKMIRENHNDQMYILDELAECIESKRVRQPQTHFARKVSSHLWCLKVQWKAAALEKRFGYRRNVKLIQSINFFHFSLLTNDS